MKSPQSTVDVRDMLCAQALAVVAKAAAQMPPGGSLEILYDTDDVKRDVLTWAKDRGCAIQHLDPGRLLLG